MNTKYHTFICMIAIFLCASCDVTDRIPKDAVTDLNYWTKTDDLRSYANSFYPNLTKPDHYDGVSDNVVTLAPDGTLFNTNTVPTDDKGWSFKDDWKQIRNCNYFLARYNTVQGDAREINHYVAEVRFFRAYEYFKKVCAFGDVPWFDKDLQTDSPELMKPRDPRKFVIDKIIEDLEYGAGNKTSQGTLKLPNEIEKGRIHKYAALQLLARVCLYEATWMKYRQIQGWEPYMTKAWESAEAIMNSGVYSIVKADPLFVADPQYPPFYKQQFIQEDLTSNKECVLPRIYILDKVMHGHSRGTNQAGRGASKDFIESFLCNDGLPITLSNKFLGDNSLTNEITNRDPRLWNIIDNQYLPYTLDGSKPVVYPVSPVNSTMSPTGYMIMKFRSPEPSQNEANHSTYDWYIFRYAEVLLIYAEAKAELNDLQPAVDAVNLLRARLDLPEAPMGRLSISPLTDPLSIVNGKPRYGYTISNLLYEIRRERRVELAFEGFRWDDICRWNAGVLIENPKTMLGMAVNQAIIDNYTVNNGGTNPFDGRLLYDIVDWNGNKKMLGAYASNVRIWDNKLYLTPIPKNQITLNPSLVQNPGW